MNNYLAKLLSEGKLPVIFDYDGVLFEARWRKERIAVQDATIEDIINAYESGDFTATKPIPLMQKLVSENITTDKFVLSHMQCEAEHKIKIDQIAKYYPEIPSVNVMYATSVENKLDYMKKIQEEYGGFIYIDDTLSYARMFENTMDENCKFFHVSSLYV